MRSHAEDLGSLPSVHPKMSDGRRAGRPSLLSQLTRLGNIEEPEHADDIAYITPEMLDGGWCILPFTVPCFLAMFF